MKAWNLLPTPSSRELLLFQKIFPRVESHLGAFLILIAGYAADSNAAHQRITCLDREAPGKMIRRGVYSIPGAAFTIVLPKKRDGKPNRVAVHALLMEGSGLYGAAAPGLGDATYEALGFSEPLRVDKVHCNSITSRAPSGGSSNCASLQVGLRPTTRGLFDMPQGSKGTPSKFVSTLPSSFTSW